MLLANRQIFVMLTIAGMLLAISFLSGCVGSGFKKSAANVIETCDASGVKKVEVNYKQEVIRAECKENDTGFWGG